MKPLHDLAALQAGIAAGTVRMHIKLARRNRLVELLGDDYMETVNKICRQLKSGDFCGSWPDGNPQRASFADVYGIMRDAAGERSEEEYAWYVKFGVRPETSNCDKFVLSFHPTGSLRLLDNTELRSTVIDEDDFAEEDDG